MFARLRDDGTAEAVQITIDDVGFDARRGDTVAAALLAAGVTAFRAAPISGAPRAPYCLMGTCFECAVEIDGERNRRACMTQVSPGMRVVIVRVAPAAEPKT